MEQTCNTDFSVSREDVTRIIDRITEAVIVEECDDRVPHFRTTFDKANLLSGIWRGFCQMLGRMLSEEQREGLPSPKAEDIVLALFRRGVPKEAAHVRYKHITVSLPNGSYRFYRETSGFPAGSFVLLGQGRANLAMGIPSDLVAAGLIAFDSALPELDGRYETVRKEKEAARRRREARMKGNEIIGMAVRQLIKEKLEPFHIEGTCKVDDDGIVTLRFSQTFSGEVTMPFSGLSEFLSDTDRVKGMMVSGDGHGLVEDD